MKDVRRCKKYHVILVKRLARSTAATQENAGRQHQLCEQLNVVVNSIDTETSHGCVSLLTARVMRFAVSVTIRSGQYPPPLEIFPANRPWN